MAAASDFSAVCTLRDGACYKNVHMSSFQSLIPKKAIVYNLVKYYLPTPEKFYSCLNIKWTI